MKPMAKPNYYIASFSGGKDSTAMVLRLIELGEPLDEVLCCDTTMEFPAMYRHIEKVKDVIESAGIKFTMLKAEYDFEYLMLHHVPNRKKETLQGKAGYSWPDPLSRWCTRALKTQVINRHLRSLRERYNIIQYIGLAADEQYRLERKENQAPGRRYPLVDWTWTEANAMSYCRAKGYDWEGLYDHFPRVSCWCCPLQGFDELRELRQHFPELWQKLQDLDAQTWRKFRRGYSVQDIEKRFALEEALTEQGHSIKNKQFFADLKCLLAGETTIETILKDRKEPTT